MDFQNALGVFRTVLSSDELCDYMHCDSRTIRRWESGRTKRPNDGFSTISNAIVSLKKKYSEYAIMSFFIQAKAKAQEDTKVYEELREKGDLDTFANTIANEIMLNSKDSDEGKSREPVIDPCFGDYINKQFELYKERNIAVSTPQLLSMTLRYVHPDGKEPDVNNRALDILNCFEYRERHAKQYGNVLLKLLSQIDDYYIKSRKTYDDKQYSDYQKLIHLGIEKSPEAVQDGNISSLLFCYFILQYSNGETVNMIKNHLGDDFNLALECIKNDKLPSFPTFLELNI